MTIEEKAKAYDKAIRIAQETYNTQPVYRNWLGSMFPELCESEDERIRKRLIDFFEDWRKNRSHCWGITATDILAWLEKQGEKLPVGFYYVNSEGKKFYSDTFKYGDVILHVEKQGEQNLANSAKTCKDDRPYGLRGECSDCQVNYAGECKGSCELKRNEQKPQRIISAEAKEALYGKSAWSEKDERIRQCLIRDQEKALDDVRNDKYGHSEIISDLKEMYRERIDWLKSLKDKVQPQSQWKPSDKHYELEEFAKIVRGNLTGISKAVQELFEAKYLQLTGNKMYGGYKD